MSSGWFLVRRIDVVGGSAMVAVKPAEGGVSGRVAPSVRLARLDLIAIEKGPYGHSQVGNPGIVDRLGGCESR